MEDLTAVESLADDAQRHLTEDADPCQVFQRLADGGASFRSAALATCIALGIARSEAEQQLKLDDDEFWGVDSDVGSSPFSDAAECADVLEQLGAFDRRIESDADQRRAGQLLGTAVSHLLPLGSGYVFRLSRLLRTGRLQEALVLLSQPEQWGRHPDTTAYWTALVQASEVLGKDGSADYIDAIQRCQQQLTRYR
jgi:hypothetical protein